jgi:hypothetical protein
VPEGERHAWWQTAPGLLTAAAGIITAVTGLVVALNQAGIFEQKKPRPAAAVSARAARTATVLPAPQPTSPACGTTIPRPRDDGLTLAWARVDRASTYTVEVDCFGCSGKREWHGKDGTPWLVRTGLGIRSPIYSSREVHAALRTAGGRALRWRVWAVDHDGGEGEKSAWCQLAFAG